MVATRRTGLWDLRAGVTPRDASNPQVRERQRDRETEKETTATTTTRRRRENVGRAASSFFVPVLRRSHRCQNTLFSPAVDGWGSSPLNLPLRETMEILAPGGRYVDPCIPLELQMTKCQLACCRPNLLQLRASPQAAAEATTSAIASTTRMREPELRAPAAATDLRHTGSLPATIDILIPAEAAGGGVGGVPTRQPRRDRSNHCGK